MRRSVHRACADFLSMTAGTFPHDKVQWVRWNHGNSNVVWHDKNHVSCATKGFLRRAMFVVCLSEKSQVLSVEQIHFFSSPQNGSCGNKSQQGRQCYLNINFLPCFGTTHLFTYEWECGFCPSIIGGWLVSENMAEEKKWIMQICNWGCLLVYGDYWSIFNFVKMASLGRWERE